MSSIVLDASAILAYLYNEKGADVVEEALNQDACISIVNWAEVLSKLNDKNEDVSVFSAKFKREISSEFKILPMTQADAIKTAQLRLKTKKIGLSLGDRACLALGLRLGSPVVTADRAWSNLSLDIQIQVIR